jgi:GTP-binding protein
MDRSVRDAPRKLLRHARLSCGILLDRCPAACRHPPQCPAQARRARAGGCRACDGASSSVGPDGAHRAPLPPLHEIAVTAASPYAGLFHSARFAASVAEPEQLNGAALALLPEIAFVGRSNAGKSTAINILTQQRQLAFASKTPGRTQLLNFFTLSRKDDSGASVARAYLVDLPGYGFAKVDDATRARWDMLVGGYLATRRMLQGVVLVMDARRPLLPADLELLRWLQGRESPQKTRLHLLLSKADQLGTMDKRRALAAAEAHAEALPMPTSVQLFSAPKREGIVELQDTLGQLLGV